MGEIGKILSLITYSLINTNERNVKLLKTA